MNLYSKCVLMALVAAVSAAQPAERKHEIRGTVFEEGLNRGVAGAEVALHWLTAEERVFISPQTIGEAIERVKTTENGTFAFTVTRAGAYYLAPSKEGYVRSMLLFGRGPSSTPVVRIRDDQPDPEVRMPLSRPGQIGGRIVDDETRAPMARYSVGLSRVEYDQGRLMRAPGGSAQTDESGRFVCKNLPPGEYVVSTRPTLPWKDTVLKQFTEKDAETVDRDYEEHHSELPMALGSGMELDAGTIPIRKTSYYRVRINAKETGCPDGEKFRLYYMSWMADGRRSVTGPSELACGAEYLLKGVTPGPRRLFFVARTGGAPMQRGAVPFEITDKNLSVGFTLRPGVRLTGQFRADEGSKLPAAGQLSAMFIPMDGVPYLDESYPSKPDEEGRFQRENFFPGAYSLRVEAPGQYVKDVLYNGIPKGPGPLRMFPDAISHHLEIVVGDKPASLSGTVGVRGKPTADAVVMLVRWPYVKTDDPRERIPETDADRNGRYQLTDLAPGTYRVVAVTQERYREMQKPGRLLAALQSASDVELGAGAVRTVNLEPVE